MGLCKCPKRKTTSHFCFHHCVNVCEHCIVNNHTTCVVKSYTTWLKEASGNVSSSSVSASALCAVCQKQFVHTSKEIDNLTINFRESDGSIKTAVRLLCYHVVHAQCLPGYVIKLLKENGILKCPSCARLLWLQQDPNDLSPVALQLYKHLLNHGKWWGQVLITNKNVEDIEKYLLEDETTNTVEESQLFDNHSILETNPSIHDTIGHISSQTSDQPTQLTNNDSNYYIYNSPQLVHSVSNPSTVNHRNSTHQTFQPIHQRNFNNNYGIDMFTPQLQQQCSTGNMLTTPNSDLSNRYAVATTPLLSNNDDNLSPEKEQDPSKKYRPKKFFNQSWSLSIQRLLQYFTSTNNRTEETSTRKVATTLIICVLIIIILLVAITSYTRSNNEPFNNNSIDYGGGDDEDNSASANIKNYNNNNL